MSHCLVQEVVGRVHWFLGSLVSWSAGGLSLSKEFCIDCINWWEVVPYWVFICNNYVILVCALLFKSTGVWLWRHLSKMWLRLMLKYWCAVLISKVWRWGSFMLLWYFIWINLDNNILDVIISYVVCCIMILVEVIISIINIVDYVRLRLALVLIIKCFKGILVLLWFFLIIILNIFEFLDV